MKVLLLLLLCLQALSAASVTMYRSVVARFCSSSSHPYYLINMHDLLHVYEGLLLLSLDTKAQIRPQFSLLGQRGFQSSSRSSNKLSSSRTKSSLKLKSGRNVNQQLSNLSVTSEGIPRKKPVKQNSDPDPEEIISTLRMLIRVWCHESTRVYLDRSTETRDRLWFLKLLESCIKHCFCGIGFRENLASKDPFGPGHVGHTAGTLYNNNMYV